MNYSEIKYHDVVDGEGIRVSLFVSGCDHHCKGCFNADTWDHAAGRPFTDSTMDDILSNLEPEYIAGLSLLGGDPFSPKNRKCVSDIVSKVKERYPKKDIWLWTGYLYDDILKQAAKDKDLKNILDNIDVLIDGPFVEDKKDLMLAWRGSSNQKIYDFRELEKR